MNKLLYIIGILVLLISITIDQDADISTKVGFGGMLLTVASVIYKMQVEYGKCERRIT